MMKIIRSLLGIIIVFGIGYLFGFKQVKFYKVISHSMEPTLKVGDRIVAVKPEGIKRKDIVVIKDPNGGKDTLTKRIIGFGGETVEVKGGSLYINGEKIYEPYIKEKPSYKLKVKVPPGYFFLLGDNRNKSEDSSVWGPVSEDLIIGKVICVYWPFKRFKIFLNVKE